MTKWNLNYSILTAVIIILSTLFLPISRADICDPEVLPNANCEVRSPAGIITNGSYTIYDDDGIIVEQKQAEEFVKNSGIYNFTFNKIPGAYSIVWEGNTTATINARNTLHNITENIPRIIGDTINITIGNITAPALDDIDERLSASHGAGSWTTFEENTDNRIYWLILFISAVLFSIGIIMQDHIFKMFSGFITVVLGIYTARTGFFGFSNEFVNTAFIIIITGIGFYITARAGYDVIDQWWFGVNANEE